MSDVTLPARAFWKDWRWGLLAAAVAGVAWWLCFQTPHFWVMMGMGEPFRPFLDLYGLLAASDAVQLGLNPFVPGDLDPYHRPHVYSSWWLVMASWGWGRNDTLWLGATLAAAVLVTAVVMVRPRTGRECAWLLALLLSPAFVFAINRANNDEIILVFVSLGLLCFRREGLAWRLAAVALFALSAVLKYYPLATVVLLLALRDRARVWWGAGLYLLVLVLAWPGLVPGLQSALRNAPVPVGLYAYGAPALMRDFDLTAAWLWQIPGALMLLWALLQSWPELRRPAPAGAITPVDREFVCGAAMLVGLFFIGASFVYKLIFVVWLLPWLWARDPAVEGGRWRRVMSWLLFAVLWLEGLVALALNCLAGGQAQELGLAILKAGMVVTQLLTWALVATLCRWTCVYALRWAASWWREGRRAAA